MAKKATPNSFLAFGLASHSLPGIDGDALAGVAKSVDATDLNQLECSSGNRRCRTAQIRGNLLRGNPEPSPGNGEGVETRRAAPKAAGYGEGIVQTTNLFGRRGRQGRAAKAVEGMKIRFP